MIACIIPIVEQTISDADAASVIELAREYAATDVTVFRHLRAIDIAIDLAVEFFDVAALRIKDQPKDQPNGWPAHYQPRVRAAEAIAYFHVHLLNLYLDTIIAAPTTINPTK